VVYEMSEATFNLLAVVATSVWLTVYALMIRRGFKDKSYGMPVTALCFNISWEIYFAFLAGLPPVGQVGNIIYLILDLGILYTCWLYGREDFDWPILKKHLHSYILLTIPASFVLIYMFIKSFNDYGILSTLLVEMLYSSLLIAMIIRRNSVKGQSFYIGLLILIGDILGNSIVPYTQRNFQPDVSLSWIYVCVSYIILCNIAYLLLYYKVARRDGINLWRRL